MILFRAEAIFASDISKFGMFLPAIDREDLKKSKPPDHLHFFDP